MELFVVVSTLYLLFITIAIVLVDFKERNIFFWGLITVFCTPLVTIVFMLCLGDSERKKEEKVSRALRNIVLMELEVLSNIENNHCLSRYRDVILARHVARRPKEEKINAKLAFCYQSQP